MKNFIVLVLLLIVVILLCISCALEDCQRRLFEYCLGSRSRGVYRYINTSGDSFKTLQKYNSYRNTLHFICIIIIIAIIAILLIF